MSGKDLQRHAPDGAVDAQTTRAMAPYFNASKKFAKPSRPEQARRRVLARVRGFGERYDEWKLRFGARVERYDLAPDLAENIGSRRWFRGLGTMLVLGAFAFALWPDFGALEARAALPRGEDVRAEFRTQRIAPLALGGDSGRRVAPTAQVIPLASAPERPQIELVATLASGESLATTLRRAGVAAGDIDRAATLIEGAMASSAIEPGTRFDIVLGRRPAPGAPRPLDALTFRARFDLELAIERAAGQEGGTGSLALARNVIRVDDTPLRLRGTVGSSLYRSMRAAGVPASAVQDYVRALDNQIDLDREVRGSDEFDIILAFRRAATGERQAGRLLYAGIDRGGEPKTQLMRWGEDGQFYEASGVGEQRQGLVSPVPGPISSRYGMRRHPILGYRRMHSGLDFRARHGTPIVAVTDGRVRSAGRSGGCGLTVRLEHDGNLSTRYCHMSRMAVRSGQTVRRGQVIGYVGSTGLSTGPHLHYEMYRGGRSIDPGTVSYVTRAVLSGTQLIDFRRQLIELKQVEPGAALGDLEPLPSEVREPLREIEKLDIALAVD
ncbi:MAG: peptidoglycan DD-metalloendopeptidase family protein [Erythrobacter sp.]